MRAALRSAAVALVLAVAPAAVAEIEPGAADADLAAFAFRLVVAYGAGDAEALRPHLAEGLVFRDPKLGQELDLDAFLAMVAEMGRSDGSQEAEVDWAGAGTGHADVRGTWTWRDAASGRERESQFSIELELETVDGRTRVVSWLDDFRRGRMWKPAKGDGLLETDNFRIVYFTAELSTDEATRLGETLEHWYERTSEYLGRSFAEGHRLHVNVADGHASPYASAPGPDAFILVAARHARHEYGFSLVHELTHNLMDVSWLSRNRREHGGVALASGNRLFDEGFAVYVEEKLTGEGPEVWPNFGEETHAAFQTLRAEQDEPIWPVLEAEIHRERGNTRLGYLAQASFVKHLVESRGLERFLRFYDSDLADVTAVYGKSLEALELDWRSELERRFASRAEPDTKESSK